MRVAPTHLSVATSVVLLTLAAMPQVVTAQVRASEKASLSQTISGTEIEIEYSRPSMRGRDDLFGGQIFWGEVWTPGADNATTLRVSKAVTLNGVELPAGKYSLWIEVLESAPWQLVVHEDTVRWHADHPLVEEALISIPIEHGESPRFVETLAFDIQDVRTTSARLEMAWGNTLVQVDLGIDPGFELVVEPEVAEALTGEWLYDDSAQVPSDEVIEARLANPDAPDWARRYFTQIGDLQRPRAIQVQYDSETGYLTLSDSLQEALIQGVFGETADALDMSSTILIPRAEGMFMPGQFLDGELIAFNPQSSPIYEFEFDEKGRAVSFVTRGRNDEIQATGTRPGG